jgi:hypothetical protein
LPNCFLPHFKPYSIPINQIKSFFQAHQTIINTACLSSYISVYWSFDHKVRSVATLYFKNPACKLDKTLLLIDQSLIPQARMLENILPNNNKNKILYNYPNPSKEQSNAHVK